MTQRQILRQLAEVGRLRLQDFDEAALVQLLRDELVTVTGQTVSGPPTTTSASTSALTWTSPKDHCSRQTRQRTASRSGVGTATCWTTTALSSRWT